MPHGCHTSDLSKHGIELVKRDLAYIFSNVHIQRDA